MKMSSRTLTTMSASTVLLAALALAGCNRNTEQAQAPADSGAGVAQSEQRMEQKVDQAQASAERGMDNAANAVKGAAQDASQATKNAAAEVGDKVGDAMITTTVNAELAKDPKLSALKINVDTADGKVALRGTAPDSASRERATQLAMAVKGVVSVDNQLTIEPAKS